MRSCTPEAQPSTQAPAENPWWSAPLCEAPDNSDPLRELAALSEQMPALWDTYDPKGVKGLSRARVLPLGRAVLTHETSKFSTDTDGSQLPSPWDACYQPGTSGHLINRDPTRTRVVMKSNRALSAYKTSRAEVIKEARGCRGRKTKDVGNRPEYYEEKPVALGKPADLSPRERYTVLDQPMAATLRQNYGVSKLMGASSLIQESATGASAAGFVGEIGNRDRSGEGSPAMHAPFPRLAHSDPKAINRYDIYNKHGLQPFQTTDDAIDPEQTARNQAAEALPEARALKAEYDRVGAEHYDPSTRTCSEDLAQSLPPATLPFPTLKKRK